jgi:hypothetical protein
MFTSLIYRMVKTARITLPRQRRPRLSRYRPPCLEWLEDRTLPSTLVALTSNGHLVSFDSSSRGSIVVHNVAVNGLASNETLHTIVAAPYGALYGIAGVGAHPFNHLYTLDPAAGTATAGATIMSPTTLLGAVASIDPVTGYLRVIDVQGNNLVINPLTGAVIATGVRPAFVAGDVNQLFGNVDLWAMAYTNEIAGASSTTLYGMNSYPATLVRLGGYGGNPSPDTGATHTVAASMSMNAFTISGDDHTAYAVSNTGLAGKSKLLTVDLNSGVATQLGTFASLAAVIALAALPPPGGEINGSIFLDPDGDGTRHSGDRGVPGVTVFADINRNGRLDPQEMPYSAVSDALGSYHISHVPYGTYPVLEVGAGTAMTAPSQDNRDFGFAVAAGAGEIAVGDPLALRPDPSQKNNPVELGRAYLYSAQDGSALAELPAPPPVNTDPRFANRDAFGFSVAISDDHFVGVGSPFRWNADQTPQDKPANPDRGVVFIFPETFDPGKDDMGDLDVDFPAGTVLQDSELGLAVQALRGAGFIFTGGASAMDGSVFALAKKKVGAQHDYISQVDAGAFDSLATDSIRDYSLYGDPDDDQVEFDRSTSIALLLHDPNGGHSSFGTSVALMDRDGFVGAPAQQSGGSVQAGVVYRFDLGASPPAMDLTRQDPAAANYDHFGFAMAMVGNHEILIGAPGDSTFGPDAGAAYLFDAVTGELLQTLYSPQPRARADFGFSVAPVNDHTVVVGAPSTKDNTDGGAAYLLPIAPMVTVSAHPATANFARHPGPEGLTIHAAEGRDTGMQAVAAFDPAGLGFSTTPDSSDPSASIDWGDNTTSPGTIQRDSLSADGLLKVQGSHTYGEGGTYPITVTIATGAGALPRLLIHGSAVVRDAPLAATLHAPLMGEGQPVNQMLVATFFDSHDPNHDASYYSASVDWGDGDTSTTAAGNVVIKPAVRARTGFEVFATKPNAYVEEGAPIMAVTVSDPGGGNGTATASVHVHDMELAAMLRPPAPVEGQAMDLPIVVATFTDADPHGIANDFTARVSWGDGQVSTTAAGNIAIRANDVDGFQVLARKPAPYREDSRDLLFTVTVRDQGGAHVTETAHIHVDDAPLTLTLVAPAPVEGQPLNQVLVATFTDANPRATAADATARVDWGDGQTSTSAAGLVVIQADRQRRGVFDIRATKPRRYAEEATGLSFRVTVTDHGGATDTQAASLNVADAPLVATGLSFTAAPGVLLTNVVARFDDLDPQGAADDYTAHIDWGDSTSGPPDVTPVIIRRTGTGTFTVSAQGDHVYAAVGTYTVTVTIQDQGTPVTVMSTAQVR